MSVSTEIQSNANDIESVKTAQNELNPESNDEIQNQNVIRINEILKKQIQTVSKTPCFFPKEVQTWFDTVYAHADRTYLEQFFTFQGWIMPEHGLALVAPLRVTDGTLEMRYFSYGDTAFDYSMTPDGQERFWPASTVKLAAAVVALLKLSSLGIAHDDVIFFEDQEGTFQGTTKQLVRDAIIPSDNTAYNRLMQLAGFDEINELYLPDVFYFPTMLLQRRYVRTRPGDSLRVSPPIGFYHQAVHGFISARKSLGRHRAFCPREANCTTLAELAEVMLRVVMHDVLKEDYRLPLQLNDVGMLKAALLEAPSCIDDGVKAVLGSNARIYNKGGKVIGDDRLEVAVVMSENGRQAYLLALSIPYYEGVETQTNLLAQRLLLAVKALENSNEH